MSVGFAHGVLATMAAYAVVGVILGVPLVAYGLGRIDPAAKSAPWTFRVLVFPGVVALWPLLALRWLKSRGIR